MKTTVATVAAALALVAIALPAEAQVSHKCSGIGVQQREADQNLPHTLHLVYAQPDGHYLGNIQTRITGPGGELVNVRCRGPWLLVDLPPGTYTVAATFEGETKTRQVTISGNQRQKAVFTF